MAQQGEAAGLRPRRDGDGRQRAIGPRDRRCGTREVVAEQAARQRADVGVQDDRVCRQSLAGRERHAGDRVAREIDRRDVRRVAEADALARRQRGQRDRQRVHAAVDVPDAGALDMRHKHQRRRRLERRGAAIGGVAAKQLAQPRVLEMVAQRRPQDVEGADPPEVAKTEQAEGGDELIEARPLRADERRVEGLEHALRARGEGAVPLGFARAGESRDRRHRPLEVGEEIELFGLAPGMTGEDLRSPQRDMGVERGAGFGEDLVEHPAHGQDRGAGIDRHAVHQQLAHLAAGRRGALEHRHLRTARGEIEGGGQTADSGADDDDLLGHTSGVPRSITYVNIG